MLFAASQLLVPFSLIAIDWQSFVLLCRKIGCRQPNYKERQPKSLDCRRGNTGTLPSLLQLWTPHSELRITDYKFRSLCHPGDSGLSHNQISRMPSRGKVPKVHNCSRSLIAGQRSMRASGWGKTPNPPSALSLFRPSNREMV